MMYTLAHLEKEKLADVQSLEKSLGKTLVAFAPKDVSFVPLKDDEDREGHAPLYYATKKEDIDGQQILLAAGGTRN